jgi:hypothetical protein
LRVPRRGLRAHDQGFGQGGRRGCLLDDDSTDQPQSETEDGCRDTTTDHAASLAASSDTTAARAAATHHSIRASIVRNPIRSVAGIWPDVVRASVLFMMVTTCLVGIGCPRRSNPAAGASWCSGGARPHGDTSVDLLAQFGQRPQSVGRVVVNAIPPSGQPGPSLGLLHKIGPRPPFACHGLSLWSSATSRAACSAT